MPGRFNIHGITTLSFEKLINLSQLPKLLVYIYGASTVTLELPELSKGEV